MPSPSLSEFDTIKQIVEQAASLSPASLRFVRARILEILKAQGASGSGQPEPHVLEAQEKTGKLFRQRAEGE